MLVHQRVNKWLKTGVHQVEMGFSAEMQKYDQSQGRITIRSQDAMSFKTQLKKKTIPKIRITLW